jgi:anti-sigma factor ChrR (cupin superfamily)
MEAATMTASINGDMSVRAAVDTAQMPWTPSPSGTVWRKRVHLVGPAESGQVTSVVRYEPRSTFHAHDHPGGEEILVLDGVFSDEHGEWGAGTYLLNPEGFRHTPFSEPGCLLLVKLRQYAGRDRRHVVVDTNTLDWVPTATAGVAQKLLYEQTGFGDTVALEQWVPGADLGAISYPRGVELFVMAGEFGDEQGVYGGGSWLRLPAQSTHHPRTARGCTLYVKRAGLPYLLSARV